MIVLRSSEEIAVMEEAGNIAAAALEKVKGLVAPGVETKELDRAARSEILKRNGYPAFKDYKGFPGNICTSVNEVIVHGIPSARKLKSGDIISVDIGVKFRDYFADAAITVPVGRISDEARRLMDVTKSCLDIAIAKAVAGARISDISAAVQEHAQINGFSVVRQFVGHGIGTHLHEEPEVPNFGAPGRGVRLEPGMVFAIEPMINAGTFEAEILEDGWTAVTKDRKISAHFEHTIAVTDKAAKVLTARGKR